MPDRIDKYFKKDAFKQSTSLLVNTELGSEADFFSYFAAEPQSIPPGTIGEEAPEPSREKASVARFKTLATTFEDVYKTAVFPDNFLIINDVILSDVPTTAIKFISTDGVFIAETLRTSAPVVTPNNAQSLSIQLSLIFKANKEGHDKLRRLVSVISVHPIVFIYNNKIRKNLGIKSDENTIFILEHGTLRSSPDAVGSMILDLTLHYFNFKPFSNHFWFNANMPNSKNNKTRLNESMALTLNNQSLGDLTGYEASSHSLEKEAEDLIREMKIGTYKLGNDKLATNQPVPFPAASETWMYLADHLEYKSSALSEETTDYIGFEFREYEQISPPKGAQASAGNAKQLIEKEGFPTYSQFFDANKTIANQITSKTASMRKTEAYADDAGGDSPTNQSKVVSNVPFVPIKISGTGQAWIEVYNSLFTNGKDTWQTPPSLEAGIHISAHLQDEKGLIYKYGGSSKCNLLFYETVYRSGYQVPIIKRKRGKGYPGIPGSINKIKKGTNNMLRLTGRTKGEIQKIIDQGIPVGLFWNGPAGHVINMTDLRRIEYNGDKIIKITAKGLDQHGHNVHRRVLKQYKEQNKDVGITEIEIAACIPIGTVTPLLDPMYPLPEDTPYAPKKATEEQMQSMEETFGDYLEKQSNRYNTTYMPRQLDDRVEWIRGLESKQDLTYYWGDAKIRNIFYRTLRADVVSDIDAQKNGTGLKNLVCSSISLNFGHRIVSQRLVGQDTCTWQFLGAGNKSGTAIFTFAGEEGRKSADYVKSMFHRARANAKLYGAIIPDAGSIKINREDPTSNKINNLMALLNINYIVISEINETSVPGSTDKHQLIISFIAQEFAKEGLERRFATSTDSKKRIISRIFSFIKSVPISNTVETIQGVEYRQYNSDLGAIRDNKKIIPDPEVIETNNIIGNLVNGVPAFEPYRIKKSGIPAWLAEVIIKASRIAQKLNGEMPPSSWFLNKGVVRTWKDRYAEFGADHVMLGRVQNIEPTERNKYDGDVYSVGNPYDSTPIDLGSTQLENQRLFKNQFDHNGAKHTSDIHSGIYNRFADQVNIIVEEVKKYMVADKVNFKKYFGSLSDDLLKAVTSSIGECYEDMMMPLIPGGNLPLPPEFYVFNDADEDPALSALTDDYNMEAFLTKHIRNERASIKHYLKDAYLGGSYLSQNMPKILRERESYVRQFEGLQSEQTGTIGEFDFLRGDRMMGEGVKTWEPLYYDASKMTRSPDVTNGPNAWREFVDNEYDDSWFGSDQDKVRTKFMDNIVALSPYLKHGRGSLWSRGEDSSSNVDIIEAIYDDNWKKIAFGPNPDFATVDEKLDGHMTRPTTSRGREILKMDMAKARAKAENKAINIESATGNVRTVLPDGSVTVGSSRYLEESASEDKLTAAASSIYQQSNNNNYNEMEIFFNKYFENIGKTREKGKANSASSLERHKASLAWQRNQLTPIYNKDLDVKDAARIGTNLPSHEPLESQFANGDNDRDLAKMVKGIAFGTKAQDLSVRRAYPTFKIYFIEDDSEETEKIDGNVMRAYDDFYSYSSIQEIKIIRSRKVAGDLAVIRMTNVGGKLLRKRYGDKDPLSVDGDLALKYGVGAEYATGFFADTEKENPFEKMILQDGVKTQIRLGYANDPDLLESCFLGQIVEIAPREGGKIIEIVCQGYGAELESVELGPLEDGPTFYSTQQVLSASIIQDSIVNFGRRSKFNNFNQAETRHAFTGGLGKGLSSQSIDDLILKWGDDNLYKMFYKNKFLNYPQDDNIYAPPPQVYATTWMRFWNNACIYRPLSQTPWEIFKEHELRHPGYVSMALPYGHSSRMTMFFGAKGQHYWSKPPSNKEIFLSDTLSDNVVAGRGISARALRQNPFLANQMQELARTNPEIAKAVLLDLTHYGAPISVGKAVGELYGRYIPFRNYHYFDAAHHILKNEIKTSKDGVFNEIEVLFFENENDIEEDDSENLAENIEELARKDSGRLACKLDDNLPEEHIRSYTKEFPSCVTSDMAKRYIQGLFARHLRDAYKGELIVLGEAKLKPYDICYLNDTSINMTGPIEVEAVTHIFNRDHGFISIVTPDLCVDINDYYSVSVFDLAAAAHAAMHLDDLNAVPVIGSIASNMSYLGLAASVKFMQWTQDGVPVISTPLTLGGKPFMSVAMGQKNSSLFYTWGGQWNQHWDDVKSGWEKFDLAENLMDTSRSWQESINTFMSRSKGAGYSLEKF